LQAVRARVDVLWFNRSSKRQFKPKGSGGSIHMHTRQRVLWAVLLLAPLIFFSKAVPQTAEDDNEPDIKARVARITYVAGEVQVKRAGETEWERVKQDLPIVEGDQIATDSKARIEIQLSSTAHIRLDENSYLQFVTLRDEGVALSLPSGKLSARLLDFDKDRSYLEIDAPKTTVAVQKAGIYRIDAATEGDRKQVRVSVMESGEARVYSDNAGFTLKNGRSSAMNIDGDDEGDWETAEASRYADAFDTWALDRDVAISTNLKNSYYDKYYDRYIYRAEDLNDNGEWIHTSKYGYVWRPYSNTISSYADWSPYRYGEWRWIPPFGWTWVNDEPWGWATYHHGRWFYDAGYWVWSPYGYYRGHRSWWSPALVFITIFNNNVCWYPLPYSYAYYNYNSHYHSSGHHQGHNNGAPPPVSPTPSTSPTPLLQPEVRGPYRFPAAGQVPSSGVVTMPTGTFGTGPGTVSRAETTMAKGVLAKVPDDPNTIPRLPKYEDISNRVGRTIRVERPIQPRIDTRSTGTEVRKPGSALDSDLRTTRITGRRQPAVTPVPETRQPPQIDREGKKLPDTGSVGRPVSQPDSQPAPVKTIPRTNSETKTETPERQVPKYEAPRRSVEPRVDQPKREEPKREEPRYTAPKQEQPRYEAPKREEPRSSPPPQREQPRNDTPKQQPPPQRSQPSESKPDTTRKKDG
jgi:hypothetical protein